MDVLGKTAILDPRESLLKPLAQGFKKIYYRSQVKGVKRIPEFFWVSPYEEDLDSNQVFKEAGFTLLVDFKKFYYNPRYTEQRVRLSKNLIQKDKSEKLMVAGGGCGVFSIHLNKLYREIFSYDVNEETLHYGALNCMLNKILNINFLVEEAPKGKEGFDYLAVMPTMQKEYYSDIVFDKNLVFYLLINSKDVESYKLKLNETYPGCLLQTRLVRSYGPGQEIYRFHLYRP